MKSGKSERKDPPLCCSLMQLLMKAEVTHLFNGVVGVILLIISIAPIPSASGVGCLKNTFSLTGYLEH